MEQYQVSFVEAIKRAFSKYCVFTGRASRSEYWWFSLFITVITLILCIPMTIESVTMMQQAMSTGVVPAERTPGIMTYLYYIWALVVLLPSWGVLFRRLHDTGRSGWNCLWSFLPIAGSIVLIVLCCQPSQPMENKYGPVPNVRI